MGMHLAAVIAWLFRIHQRHVAIDTCGTLLRVIERAGALPRYSAGLPVVVVVEAPEPTVVVDGHIEMDFMTRRTEFGGVLAHKGLHESLFVRIRLQVSDELRQAAHDSVFTGCQFMKRRVFNLKISVTHRTADMNDGMARRAGKSGTTLRSVDLLFDRSIESAI